MMSASIIPQDSLKEALLETLNGVLSPHLESRQAAEQRIQALEVTDEFGIYLAEFVVDPYEYLSIRQLSSVLLKQCVENHWNSMAEKFRPPELKPYTKERIKELLPLGLQESISKVRTAVAYAISRIAQWEWPENWPGLFDILVNCLNNKENEFAIHGAMKVLTEFSRDLSDIHLPIVGPIILQEMYRIVENHNQNFPTRIQERAIEIFTTIATLAGETWVYNKSFVGQHLQPIIPPFCEQFVKHLRMTNNPASDSSLRTEIIKAINCLALKLSKYTLSYIPELLPPIWETLVQSAKIYQDEVVNGDAQINNQEADSDGEINNFNNLIIATFEFISTLVEHKRFSNLLDNFLPELMHYLILFMQVTEEQIDLWTNNPSQFIEEDEECIMAYNVRISAKELLGNSLNYSEEAATNALYAAVTQHIETTNRMRIPNNGMQDNENWWKMYEAALIALGTVKSTVVQQLQAGRLNFDIVSFLNTVVLTTLNDSGAHPLLLGRCLCLGGRYAKEMPTELTLRFLEATVIGLQESQPVCIRISSVKSIFWYCEAAIASKDPALKDILRPQLPAIFQGLFALANQPSEAVLTLVMEAFTVIVELDKSFTASVESKLCPLTIAVFVKLHSDPDILCLCQEIFRELTRNPECIGPLQARLIPTLVSMMNITSMENPKDEEATRGVALDVLQVLVQHSPQPLSSALIDTAFPAACVCILNSTENGTLQYGGEVIRAYLSVAARQVTEHRDNEGRTGLQYILEIIAQLLNPRSSEFTATFVGKLVTTLIRKIGNSLGENLAVLLKAVLSKMQRIETPAVMQSLLMIYAHLINSEFDAVLNFLSTVPGPTGQSALAFTLTEWVGKQKYFFGNYDRKVATVALSKILEYGVTHNDTRLNEITVEGDQIYPETTGVVTRGKAVSQPPQWTTIPVLVKIFKLIIYELGNTIEVDSANNLNDADGDDDDEDEIIDPGVETTALHFEDDEENEDDQDPDMLHDSIYHMNIAQYLRDFLRTFSAHHCFSVFLQHLNGEERSILNKINISI